MNKECAIVQNLIPLVNDEVTSDESKEFVLKHCEYCQDCKKTLDVPLFSEESLNKKWYKKIKKTSVIFLILFILLTCSFNGTKSQFQNFIFMPLIVFLYLLELLFMFSICFFKGILFLI